MIARARWAWRHLRARLARMVVVSLLLVGVFTALGAVKRAEARKEMLSVGAEMMRIPEGAIGGSGERLLFNGADLSVSRGQTSRSLGDYLAEAEASCPAHAPPLRGGDDQRGFVACVDPEAMTLPASYVYAERRGESTQFIRFRGAKPVDLRAMFPRDQDAPGSDPAALPRPASSRRALSMRVAGQPYEAVIYLDAERGLDELVAHYEAALPQSGWTTVARWRVDEGPGPRQASVVVERAGALALLLLAHDRAGTSTTFLTMEPNRTVEPNREQ